MQTNRNKSAGLTLVEVIVIGTVIAILVGIAIPLSKGITEYRKRSLFFSYVITEYSQDGKILSEYKSNEYPSQYGPRVEFKTTDGQLIIISGNWKVKRLENKQIEK